jgi:hypothetical protein
VYFKGRGRVLLFEQQKKEKSKRGTSDTCTDTSTDYDSKRRYTMNFDGIDPRRPTTNNAEQFVGNHTLLGSPHGVSSPIPPSSCSTTNHPHLGDFRLPGVTGEGMTRQQQQQQQQSQYVDNIANHTTHHQRPMYHPHHQLNQPMSHHHHHPIQGGSGSGSMAMPQQHGRLADRTAAAIQHLLETASKQQHQIRLLTNEVNHLKDAVGAGVVSAESSKSARNTSNTNSSADGSKITILRDEQHQQRSSNTANDALSLVQRIEILERPVPSVVDGSTLLRLPDAMSAIGTQLVALDEKLSTKADRREVETAHRTQTHEIKAQLNNFQEEVASKSAMLDLGESVEAVSSKLDHCLSVELSHKVDQKQLKLLKYQAGVIHEHRNLMNRVGTQMDELRHGSTQSKEQNQITGLQLDDFQNSSKRSIHDLSVQQAMALANFEKIQDQVKQQLLLQVEEQNGKQAAAAVTHQSELDGLKDRVQKCMGDLSIVATKFSDLQTTVVLSQTQAHKEAHHPGEDNDHAYTKEEVNSLLGKFVARTKLTSALDNLRQELLLVDQSNKKHGSGGDDKVMVAKVQALQNELQSLSKDYQKTKEASELATKFIKWYSRRGQPNAAAGP